MRTPWQLGPRGRLWFDRLLVIALLLPAPSWLIGEPRWAYAIFPVLQIVPLWWRRSHPLLAFGGVAVASGLQVLFVGDPLYSQIAFPIAVYSVARFAGFRAGLAAVAVGLVGAFVGSYRWLATWGGGPASVTPQSMTSYVVTVFAIVLIAWAIGLTLQSRARYVAGLVERAEQAVRAADQQAALAAAEERARIARDLHDVVAHGLSVIVVQADGARYAAADDPRAVVPALETISATGRTALADMRRMLGLMRADPGQPARPQPRLDDIAELVAEARGAGARIDATLPADSAAVPDAVALTTYRVVQEALSNVRRHAGPTPAVRVRVDVDPDPPSAVRVEITDDGRGAASHDDGRGLGLVGMRERVALHGGQVQAGPAPGGGFRLTARIPCA